MEVAILMFKSRFNSDTAAYPLSTWSPVIFCVSAVIYFELMTAVHCIYCLVMEMVK